ncbi:MAG: DUF2752 domain-containing protein [Bacteroidota bacterium]
MVKKKLYIVLAGLSLVGYGWIGWNFIEGSEHSVIPSVCLFKEITGLPCPSCGTTRSLLLLMGGHFHESLMMNPFGIVLALALVIIPLWIVIDTLGNSDSFYKRYTQMEHLLAHHKLLAAFAAAIVMLNWFWNISKGL